MHWLNLPSNLHRTPNFIRATAEQVGIWWRLMSYCAEQENNGQILGCSDWTDAMWSQIAQTTVAQLRQPCTLWHWNSPEALHVHDYPAAQEYAMKKRRRGSAKGGLKRTAAKRAAAKENGAAGGRPKRIVKFTPPPNEVAS